MRIVIPEFGTKKELFAHLVANKTELIDNKKSMPIYSDCVSFNSMALPSKGDGTQKANTPVTEDVDVLRVKVIANTANWIDSHMDMLLPDSAKKSIGERKNIIPHLHDHIHQIGAKVGEVVDILLADYSFSELGIKGIGSAQGITFITDVMKSYNEQVFNQYKAGKVNQHSIGLQYMKLSLAINDSDYKEEYAEWQAYYSQAINKEVADNDGFFWVIKEIKLIENSAVLFGANEITPTIDNNVKNIEPPKGTQHNESEQSTQDKKKEYYINLLKTKN